MRFTKPSKVIGLDIGTHSVKAVQAVRAGSKTRIEALGYAPVDRNRWSVDPVAAQADAIYEALERLSPGQSMLVGAIPGQAVVIRYPRLRNVSADQIERAVEVEASQNIPYDLADVNLDWSLLEEEMEGDERQLKVLLVAAKHEVIDSRVQVADAAELEFSILSVDSLALADAAEACQYLRTGETVAMVNVGASSVSIHFAKDGISNFIRDVSWGARDLVQAIAKARRCDFDEAERILANLENELAPAPARAAAPAPPPAPPAAEERDTGDVGLVDDPLGLDDSPRDDGGRSLLDPLDDELQTLQPADMAGGGAGGSGGSGEDLREALASPVNKLMNEVRRSFDYYEHQLYERPVDRVILSGGVAHLSVLRDAVQDDLGIDAVQVANPFQGNVSLSGAAERDAASLLPSQYVVAVGLAARGIAEL